MTSFLPTDEIGYDEGSYPDPVEDVTEYEPAPVTAPPFKLTTMHVLVGGGVLMVLAVAIYYFMFGGKDDNANASGTGNGNGAAA